MNTYTKAVIIIASFIFLMACLLMAPWREDKKYDEWDPIGVPTQPAYEERMIDEYRVYFMSGCLETAPEQYDYCSCTYNYLIGNYGIDQTVEMAIDLDETGEVGKEMYRAVSACQKYVRE